MSVEDAGSIDNMGISKSDGKVVLAISDHLSWENEKSHFNLLEKKIGGYLEFVKSGQFVAVLPDSRNKDVRIELIYQFQPSEVASRFLSAAKQQLQSMGVELTYRALPEGY
jgi:hypothetical protein